MGQIFRPYAPTEALDYFENKMHFTTGPMELDDARKNSDMVIIDVRAKEDFDKGHIPGAMNLPESDWDKFTGLSKEKLNVLYCYSHVCHLAARAAVEFSAAGYSIMELDGGFDAWKDHELEIETSPRKLGLRTQAGKDEVKEDEDSASFGELG